MEFQDYLESLSKADLIALIKRLAESESGVREFLQAVVRRSSESGSMPVKSSGTMVPEAVCASVRGTVRHRKSEPDAGFRALPYPTVFRLSLRTGY